MLAYSGRDQPFSFFNRMRATAEHMRGQVQDRATDAQDWLGNAELTRRIMPQETAAIGGVSLEGDLRSVATTLATRFSATEQGSAYYADGMQVYITDGPRTPHDQADRMYDKLAKGGTDAVMSLYSRKDLAQEGCDEWTKHEGEPAHVIIRALAAIIQSQVDRGQYISKHLLGMGFDVRTRDMSGDQLDEFIDCVNNFERTRQVFEGDHLHVEVTS